MDGTHDGMNVGEETMVLGEKVGKVVGLREGDNVGSGVDFPGKYVGSNVGKAEGAVVDVLDGKTVGLPNSYVGA